MSQRALEDTNDMRRHKRYIFIFLSCCGIWKTIFRDFAGKGDIWEQIGLRPCSIVAAEVCNGLANFFLRNMAF